MNPTFWPALGGAILVFFATTAGALPVFFMKKISSKAESWLLGLSAGVMLGASFFSLLMPALELTQKSGSSPLTSAILVGGGLLFGALGLYLFHQVIPHEHILKVESPASSSQISRQWLVVLAIALHNLPEGLAVGVGAGSGDFALSTTLSLAIAIQDFPEGLIVALGLLSIGLPRTQVWIITAWTGLIESLGVFIGYLAISWVSQLLPFAFALCAGAMMFVVSHEVIPESHQKGHEKQATAGILIGFVLLMILDFGLH